MALFGTFWSLVSFIGTFWSLVSFIGTFWSLVSLIGTFWSLVSFIGTFWSLVFIAKVLVENLYSVTVDLFRCQGSDLSLFNELHCE